MSPTTSPTPSPTLHISPQAHRAATLYSPRAAQYNFSQSWHPSYSRRLTDLISFRDGNAVLSLCCGTGLELLPIAMRVGEQGLVVGVDVCRDMLDVARGSLGEGGVEIDEEVLVKGGRTGRMGGMGEVVLGRGDVTHLEKQCSQEEETGEKAKRLVPPQGFDVIICSNSFPLLPNPSQVLRHWHDYLRPEGGLLVVDIPHDRSIRSGFLSAAVADRLGTPLDPTKSWVGGVDKFKTLLEQEGYQVERVLELDKVEPVREVFYDALEDADGQFEYVVRMEVVSEVVRAWRGDDKARQVWREEFARLAEGDGDGRVEVVEGNWVLFARRTG
ncbi:S-adenosyl-L-methionine-dependent methyltransferase [Coniochaeta sp. 2T2.1]|nr:S-adenosyl-L-methionine-dependent methyltransferase [Coniochaeta sp. 2T2.1]